MRIERATGADNRETGHEEGKIRQGMRDEKQTRRTERDAGVKGCDERKMVCLEWRRGGKRLERFLGENHCL